jgi:hypothetical protein
MPKTAFLPSLHGFHFPNQFVNVMANTPFGPITTGGRCGGMAYASLDYFFHHTPVPNCVDNAILGVHDFSASNGVPPDGTVLADFILLRLMTTFAQYGYTSLMWTSASDHATGLGPGRVPVTKNNEWPRLRAHLDQGIPVTLGLVNTTNSLAENHQVVAYDYSVDKDAAGTELITISIYDNNFPDDDTVTIQSTVDLWTNPHWNEANSRATAEEIWAGWWVQDGAPASWYGVAGWMVQPISWILVGLVLALVPDPALVTILPFFGIMPGSTEDDLINDVGQLMTTSPTGGLASPPLVDLVLSQAIAPSSAVEFLGDSYRPKLTITNQGPYAAHAQFLALVSGVAPLDALLRDATNPLVLAPGQSFSPAIQCQIPSSLPPGPFSLTAQYVTLQRHGIVLPALSNLQNTASLSIFPDPTVTIAVLAETQEERTQGGVIVGGWLVQLQASPAPAAFTPVSYDWKIQSGAATQRATGESVSVFVPIGSRGQPLAYSHMVSVVASDAQGDTASATYSLIFSEPRGSLTWQIDPRSKNAVTSERFGSGTGWVQNTITTPSLEDAVVDGLEYLFDPVTVAWSPQPAAVEDGELTGVYSMDGQTLQVSATVEDAIGQTLSWSAWLPGATIETTHGSGWTPPRGPGEGSRDQGQGAAPRGARFLLGDGPRGGYGASGETTSSGGDSPLARLVTGAELAAHVVLVRRFAADATRRVAR